MNHKGTINYLNLLPNEIIMEIIEKCELKDKISLIKTCKHLYKFKFMIKYDFSINYSKVNNLVQKNKIKHKQIKKLLFDVKKIKQNKLIKFKNLNNLTFGGDFNQPINKCIPYSVTHFDVQSKFL